MFCIPYWLKQLKRRNAICYKLKLFCNVANQHVLFSSVCLKTTNLSTIFIVVRFIIVIRIGHMRTPLARTEKKSNSFEYKINIGDNTKFQRNTYVPGMRNQNV